jgi:hypothetical protein
MQSDFSPDRLFSSWPSKFLMRPWFDWVAVRFVTGWYCPLSRAWAAGIGADGSVDRFKSVLGGEADTLPRAESVLELLTQKNRQYQTSDSHWQDNFFSGAEVTPEELSASASARFAAAKELMTMRRAFLPMRKTVPIINWNIAGPADVQRAHGLRLQVENISYPAPPPVVVEQSRSIAGPKGQEFWLRMPSPVRSTDDMAWAHVFMPVERPVRGVVVSLHGVLMEPEMWPLADLSGALVERGFCVIRPEAPWHGRRRLCNFFGGEPVFARGILGFIELFEAWVMETALWIRWGRDAVNSRVALGGVSLGALTAQIVASVCHRWPAEMRPDSALLITTTGELVEGALKGSLALHLDIEKRLLAAGWTPLELDRWRPLMEPDDVPALEPDRIVMVLGDADTVTPFEGGLALARRWSVPAENLFIGHQGHFSSALGLYRNTVPVDRAAEIFGS